MANQISDQTRQPWQVGQVRYLKAPPAPGEGVEAGLWRGTSKDVPDRSRVRYKRDEYIYVISGMVRLETDGGKSHDLRPGDCFAFNRGDVVYWTILSETFEEFFVYV